MTYLILAGSTVVGSAVSVEQIDEGVVVHGSLLSYAAGVTGVVELEALPADFEPARYSWDGGALVRLPDDPALVAQAAAEAAERINREAGEQRARHITVTAGQEGTYTAKQAEAERYAATGGVGAYPYLEAEAEATGDSVAAVAELVSQTAAAWTLLNAAIEGKRRGALVAVGKATSVAEVEAVFPIVWPAA